MMLHGFAAAELQRCDCAATLNLSLEAQFYGTLDERFEWKA